MSDGMIVEKLGAGIHALSIPANRFKTTRIHLRFLLPLDRKTVAAQAMLPFLLSRACRRYPNYTALNLRLAQLYGATLSADAGKVGDMQVLDLFIGGLNDRFALDKSEVLPECAELLRDLIFDPPFVDGTFSQSDFDSEKEMMLQRIEGDINEKRVYALNRLTEEMCADEPCGLRRYGTTEQVSALTVGDVHQAWKRMLDTAVVLLSVIGQQKTEGVLQVFAKAFETCNRQPIAVQNSVCHKAPVSPKMVEERLQVTQGKLAMGFRTKELSSLRDEVATRLMVDMLGGGPYSLCFENVREKQSLCYYCAARFIRQKSILVVDSGIEEQNRTAANKAILQQLETLRNGDFPDTLLEYAKLSMCDTVRGVYDAPGSLDEWFSGRVLEQMVSPKEYVELLGQITKEEVVQAAKAVALDTVYFLGGVQ